MRSRQAPALELTGQEIASSNTTLNTLLGVRQKSWMTGASGSVRPTPRDPMRQRSSLSVLPSPAPSGEPSPVYPYPQEYLPVEENRTENQFPQSDGPRQFEAQPATSLNIREHLQQPHMQTSHGYSPSTAQVPEAQQTNLFRTQRPGQTSGSIPSLQSRLQLIDDHIRANGGWEALSNTIERPRFTLLREACADDDYFFVALHQLFCLWTIDPPRVTRIDGFRDIAFTSNAFQLITKLIRPNDEISRVHLEWFAEFPSPLHDLVARSDHYRRTLAAVTTSLIKLTSNKAPLLQQCLHRGYPPLVDEMVNLIGFISPILQAVFFTASRRTLGVPDDDIGRRMEKLFRQDREGHRLLATRFNTSFPPSAKEITERNQWVAGRYLAIRSGQTDPGLQDHLPVQSSASGSSNQNPATAPLRPVSQSPVAQQFHHGVSLPHQNPVTGTRHPVSNSPVMQQFPSGVVDPLQIADVSGRFQGSNHQPTQTSQANLAINNDPTTGQVYSNGQNATTCQTSHVSFANQFAVHLQDPSQYPQQVANIVTQNPVTVLRSNYNQTQPSRSIPNHYPGAVTTSQAQPNLYQQQAYPIPQQNNPPQAPNRNQQLVSQQIALLRRNAALATEQNARNPQRTHSGPIVLTQGSVSGTQPITIPSPTTAINRNSQRPNQNSGMKSPPLIPLNGQSLPAHAPNPEINAVHHSYLRSPYLVPRDMPSGAAGEGFARRYYQAVKEFALGPVMLSRHLTLSVFEFHVPEINFARIAKDKILNVGSPAAREIQRGTLQYRMRCVLSKQEEVKKAVDCAVADTVWPTSIFMELNGVTMDVRRKLLHGKDLPVDITHFILNNIKNQVKVSLPRPRKSRKDPDYIFAVEVVEVLQHQQILDMCLQGQRIPAQLTIDSIKQSLSGSLVDDDDISMVAGDLTINLADPFMARIFDVPVRGSSCLHRECFDLETFLLTRNNKPKHPYQISMVDVWKCPLCSKDARPYSLRVDEFLVSVRESLAQQNMLHTKSIIVAADGNWKPKPEELSTKRSASQAGLDDPDDSEEEEHKLKAPAPNKSKETEIIVLDDD